MEQEVLEEFILDLQKAKIEKNYSKASKEQPIRFEGKENRDISNRVEPELSKATEEEEEEQDADDETDHVDLSRKPFNNSQRSQVSSKNFSDTASVTSTSSKTSTRSRGVIPVFHSKPENIKKIDRVNRWHSMQEQWKKDKFLQAQSKPRHIKIEYPDYQPWEPPYAELFVSITF